MDTRPLRRREWAARRSSSFRTRTPAAGGRAGVSLAHHWPGTGKMPAAVVRCGELILVEMAAAAPQPGDDGLAKERRAFRTVDGSNGTGGSDDRIAAGGHEIAGDDVQPFFGTNRHPRRTLEHDTQHPRVARRVHGEA